MENNDEIETLDIVDLIDKNPITKLTSTYQSKLLNAIKEKFTDTEQQLFVASFYCYLNYNQNTEFVVDLDNVWQWLGFSQKAIATRTLENNFTLDRDYKRLLYRPVEQKKGRGGHNKNTIMLTIKTFKLFCLKAGTKKAEQIHEYYIKLEETLHDIIQEESNELRQQLVIATQKIEDSDKKLKKITKKNKLEKELLREKTLLEQFPNNVECVYYGFIDDTNDKNEKLVKFGQSNNLKARVSNHKNTFTNFRLVNAFRVENKQLIENCIKTHPLLIKYIRSLKINEKNQVELISMENLTVTELDKHINDLIYINKFTSENFLNLIHENKKLQEELFFVKEQNEKLKIENSKLLKSYKLDMITKDEQPTNINTAKVEDPVNLLKRLSKNKDGFYHVDGKKYVKLFGKREDVWNGISYKTRGNLTKDDFIINKMGKIVSKKKFISSKQDNHLKNVNIEKVKMHRFSKIDPIIDI